MMEHNFKKEALIFIIPAFFENRPQSIRFRKILRYYKQNNDLHIIVIFLGNKIEKNNFVENRYIQVYEYRGRKIGTYLNKFYYPENNYRFSPALKYLRKYFRFFSKFLLYPDRFILEINNLKKIINKIATDFHITGVVLTAAPHSILKLSKFVKTNPNLKNARVYLDIGDPLYNNSVKKDSIIRNAFAKYFEKKYFVFLDKLIVTNNETRAFYLKIYPKLLSSKMIAVVPMGGEIKNHLYEEFILAKKHTYKIIYAGIFYKKLRNPFPLFKAIERFNYSHDAEFFIDIYGAGMEFYESKISKPMNENIRFLGIKPNESISEEYENYDLILHIDNAFGLQTPGKNFELLLSNKPILFVYSNVESSTYKLFNTVSGVYSSLNTTDSILDSLNKITAGGVFNRPATSLNNYTWNKRSEDFFKIIN